MQDVNKAYQTLGLKQGASMKEVDEAYSDLRQLWDPHRLSENPRLRARATAQQKELRAAYETLMAHLSPHSRPSSFDQEDLSEESSPGRHSAEPPLKTSLFDDAFSERISKPRRSVPYWVIIFLGIFLVVVVTYILQSGGEEDSPTPPDTDSALMNGPTETFSTHTEAPETAVESDALGVSEIEETPSPQARAKENEPTPAPIKELPREPSVARSREVEKPSKSENPPASQHRVVSQRQTSQPAAKETPSAETTPQLLREEAGTEPPQENPAESSSPSGPSEEDQQAFQQLLGHSSVARDLVDGKIDTIQYQDWRVVQELGNAVWIDLIGHWKSGDEVHLIWSVDSQAQEIKPLSQAARNLEAMR